LIEPHAQLSSQQPAEHVPEQHPHFSHVHSPPEQHAQPSAHAPQQALDVGVLPSDADQKNGTAIVTAAIVAKIEFI